MQITVNGEPVELKEEITVVELLRIKEVEMPEMVSVELNGEILPKEQFETKVLQPEDEVEFLYFMGGGLNY